MKIAVTGSTGFIGSALCRAAIERGWDVVRLPRAVQSGDLNGVNAVLHLAGETVDGRWTARKKAEIFRSRVQGTRALVDAISGAALKPDVLVSASAVGYYGDRGDEPLFEGATAGADFLATVCVAWEREAARASQFGVRTVMLRTGIVLGNRGALRKMMKPFTFGAGGPLGNGRQFVPWIHLDDIVAMYLFAIEHEELKGPVNAVAPDYATSARVSQAIGAAMHRPALAPAPGFALRLAIGEFAETILGGQLVLPRQAQSAGFVWKHPRLEIALQTIVNPSRDTAVLHRFTAKQIVNASRNDVFAFFSDARNLQEITPPKLHFAMTRGDDPLHEGATIEYRLALRGVPFGWKTMISTWNPPHGFSDVQLHGPYALWEHVHTFTPVPGGIELSDAVTYALPLYPLGELASSMVARDVREIFAYRERVIAERFASAPALR